MLEQKRHQLLFFALFPLMCGLLLLAIAGVLEYQEHRFITGASITSGVVTDVRAVSPLSTGQKTFAGWITFVDQYGYSHQFRSNTSSSHSKWHVGQTVVVRYDQRSPADTAVLDSLAERSGGVLFLMVLGGIFFAAGSFILITAWPQIYREYRSSRRVARVDRNRSLAMKQTRKPQSFRIRCSRLG